MDSIGKIKSGVVPLSHVSAKQTTTSKSTLASTNYEQTKNKVNIKALIEKILRENNSENHISIEFNKEINRIIMSVHDDSTGEKIWQFPPEQLVSFAENFQNILSGLIVNKSI